MPLKAYSRSTYIKTSMQIRTGALHAKRFSGADTPRVVRSADGRDPGYQTGKERRGNRIASFIMQKILTRKMAVNIMGDSTKSMYRL